MASPTAPCEMVSAVCLFFDVSRARYLTPISLNLLHITPLMYQVPAAHTELLALECGKCHCDPAMSIYLVGS